MIKSEYKKEDKYWNFMRTQGIIECKFNGDLERFHKKGIEGLVRENIQNSLDAKLQEGPVKVIIRKGKIKNEDVPGYDELKERIKVLTGANSYDRLTIKDMRSVLNETESNYISFEDVNTKGLTGAEKGSRGTKKDTWGIYAYKIGAHYEEENSDIESSRGGSHGVGKIASNAASILHVMYFANCDEFGNKHIGGTVQLIEHQIYDKNENKNNCYRATGYFTKVESEGHYIPFKNNCFNDVFAKDTRGLKIIIPFLKKDYLSEKAIIKSICNNFFIAILEGKLEVEFISNSIKIEITKETISDIINDSKYYAQEIKEMKNELTPLYLQVYKNIDYRIIEIPTKKEKYKFKLYFQLKDGVKNAKTAIIRTIGMKIEDHKVKGKVRNGNYNAILIPYSSKEDSYLKTLENESHTELTASHIRSNEENKIAKKFLKSLDESLKNIIESEEEKLSPVDGDLDTSDLIKTIDLIFKKELEDVKDDSVEIKTKKGKKRRYNINQGLKRKRNTAIKSLDTAKDGPETMINDYYKGDPRKDPKPLGPDKKQKNFKVIGHVKLKDADKPNGKMDRYSVKTDSVSRAITNNVEHIEIDLLGDKAIENKQSCDIMIKVVDGNGNVLENEFPLSSYYSQIIDGKLGKEYLFDDLRINNVNLNKGKINLKLKLNDQYNKNLKFKYLIEV